jgi:hypothetical protein
MHKRKRKEKKRKGPSSQRRTLSRRYYRGPFGYGRARELYDDVAFLLVPHTHSQREGQKAREREREREEGGGRGRGGMGGGGRRRGGERG